MKKMIKGKKLKEPPVMEAQPIEKGAISSRDMFITCCRELAETIYQLAHKYGR